MNLGMYQKGDLYKSPFIYQSSGFPSSTRVSASIAP